MKTIFIDSCYWIALLHRDEALHSKAVEVGRALRGSRFVTTELVLIEVLNFCAERGPHFRENAVGLVETARNSPTIHVVELANTDFIKTLSLYRERSDKGWSLTDCASFLAMDEIKIREALSPDKHFEQAGYVALLR